jgi:putative transposase
MKVLEMSHEIFFGDIAKYAQEDSMARPKSIPIRATLVKLFPRRAIQASARASGAVIRQRRIDMAHFVWNLILGFGTGRKRTIAGLRMSYERVTGTTIEESSFYDRFTAGLVKLLHGMAGEALAKIDGIGRKLAGPLAQFQDLIITDSTVMRLHDLLAKTFPGCRTNHSKAALKGNLVYSVLGKSKNAIKITDQRRHDRRSFTVGPWVDGCLLLFDLGYYCYALFVNIAHHGGRFVSRLKEGVNPVIVEDAQARGTRSLAGHRLRDALIGLRRPTIDVTVRVSYKQRAYRGRHTTVYTYLRVVGVRDPSTGQYHLFVTNIERADLSAEEVAQVYAARWMIELLFKEIKSYYRIEDLPSGNRHVVESLVYAAILTLVVSRRLLTVLRSKLREYVDRLPTQRWARRLAAVAQDILELIVRPRSETKVIERLVSGMLLEEAIDPNVKRRPLLSAIETRSHRYARKVA